MEKTSHWAALYFVALMTFGNYVLFNLLVAILVEGFSSEVSLKKIKIDEHPSTSYGKITYKLTIIFVHISKMTKIKNSETNVVNESNVNW